MKASIKYLSSYLPENVMTNYDLEKKLDTNNDWIVSRTGIEERRIADKKESTGDMAVKAVSKLKDKGAVIEDADAVIVATSTKSYTFPSTAGLIQKAFNIKNSCLAFDISAACSGYIYALNTAASLIESGECKKVLIIAAEKCSDILNWEDRTTAILFGDGVSSALLEASSDDSKGIISTDIGSEPNDEILIVKGGGSVNPITEENVEDNTNTITMAGTEVFKKAVKTFDETINKTVKNADLDLKDLSLIITHQANTRIMNAVAKTLGLNDNKFYINIQKYGNTSAASVGIAFTEAFESGTIKEDDYVLLTAFGAGLTWGSTLIKF
ncbi:beta-ketoacyl-ACP synthase III [Brachyspira hyodysenteriae]|uniref:Beta-ketoacyl-[acyl-carrier-protein] synthase III n=2 Tax=Brachyspira hyodysenteriae TaxID=159 RepID=A0A3B6V9F3_BRAHW|nr:beta-ketoacyl-ACP synthase III [Brachyspira hyodysenteriae]ACN83955.1 3-oxoacyl-(acyl-carrier-protein) synthase III [Brachyspira hyodysenteriae WA1]ANN63936.1 3-oxoacyl-ACP synthase [Brachyspira hyodysenteriae ATCC 27164]KLI16172.1 3-oxoacyl-ACP synthase [Brachyspira hyodysenteriae]KLI16221.1 3-oxoacyl-ACP synthase [Brachyspira hyodysenteriae]KLI23944.1 3-oxoacyl-ACP synthase [Brachyspira hyodysenteriae]